MKGPFSMPVCTRKQKSGPSSADLAFSSSRASCKSRHARSGILIGQCMPPRLLQKRMNAFSFCFRGGGRGGGGGGGGWD